MMKVTVVYATPTIQKEIVLEVLANCTLEQAIKKSSIQSIFPEIKIGTTPVGINSRQSALDTQLQDGDRVEIYRPLTIDPKDARRKRK